MPACNRSANAINRAHHYAKPDFPDQRLARNQTLLSLELCRPAISGAKCPGHFKVIHTMKPNVHERLRWNEGEIVASFGAADLNRHDCGRQQLRGGAPAAHAAAREWSSLFEHETTFSGAPSPATAPQPNASKGVHNRILIADDDALVRG